ADFGQDGGAAPAPREPSAPPPPLYVPALLPRSPAPAPRHPRPHEGGRPDRSAADPPHRRGGLPLRRRQALGIRHDHHAAAFKMNPAAERAPAEELAPRRFAQVDFDPGFVVVEVKGVTPAALDPPR